MPKLILTISDTNESVTRPVILDITRQLFEITKLPANTYISYPGDLERSQQLGSAFGSVNEDKVFPFSNRVKVEVEEVYEAERLSNTAFFRPENLFIFRDDRIETSIKPAYSSTDVTINFSYRAVDKVSATRWRDDIRAHVSMNRDIYLHDISYHYLVPEEFLIILEELHSMREKVAPYGESYEKYFKANITQRASILTTLAGTQPAWGISETQMRVVGWFDFDGTPELGSKEDEADTWTITFSYKFKYDKPIACIMFYPLVIHNQLVDQKYRPDEPLYDVEKHLKSYSLSAQNFSTFEKGRQQLGVAQGISIPNFDEFLPSSSVTSTLRVFDVLTTIDTLNPKLLLSLKDLGDVDLHPEIIKFMIGEAPYMTIPNASVFTLGLYRNSDLLPITSLLVDTDLNVYTAMILSLRDYHHVRLSLITDFSTLTKSALDRLRKFGIALILILDTIDPTLNSKGLLPGFIGSLPTSDGTSGSGGGPDGKLGSGAPDGINCVSKHDLQNAINEINRVAIATGDMQIRQRNTVLTLFIQSFNKE